RWANRALEAGEASRVGGSSAMGFRGESGYRRPVAAGDWRLEVARQSRVTACVLDRRDSRPKPLEQSPDPVRRIEVLLKTDCAVAQLLRNAISARRRGCLHCWRNRGHELSN